MPAPAIHIPYTENPKAEDFEATPSKRGRPMLFQISDPVGAPLFPYLLAMHVNPQTFSEKMTKSKSVTTTYGGYIEFNWPDDLDVLSADGTTGAFIGPDTGLVSGTEGTSFSSIGPKGGSQVRSNGGGRRGTIAWERQQDLLELFRNNGIVYSPQGIPILRGRVMCIYDRGIFQGHFTTMDVNESDDKPFSFELDWEFKVEKVIYKFPQSGLSDQTSQVSSTAAPLIVPPTPGQQPGNIDTGSSNIEVPSDSAGTNVPSVRR